ncbi:helix-turn-helix domain-containing protein [Paenibacillus vandeheii]
MIQTFQATDALKGIIDYIWIVEADKLTSVNKQDIIMPLGHINIIFNFRSPYHLIERKKRIPIPDSSVIGQIKRAKHVQYGENLYQIGISLTPVGYIQSFDYPISKLTERICSVADIAPGLEQLRTQLTNSLDKERLVTAINDYFLKMISLNLLDTRHADHMLSYIEQQCGNLNVSHMAAYFGVSISTLERTFKRYTGLPPKVYGNIVKFHKSIMNIHWYTDIHEQYYDQSHFIKTCKKFAGKTVSELEKSVDELTLGFLWQAKHKS